MSGGVDSAVAALLLRDSGYAVQGLFMSNWEDDDDAYCTTASDFQDARRVCDALGIALHRVSFAAQYRERVFAHFLREYAAGRTPNPDVLCNREIKFGVCLDYMQRLGASLDRHRPLCAAAAHGRRTAAAEGRRRGQGSELFSARRRAGGAGEDPVSHRRTCARSEVRKLAHAAGLPVYDKPDSTGICFIGERPFQDFLRRHLHTEPGPIENDAGVLVGEHRGLALYTLGQRSGLSVGGRAGSRRRALVRRRQGRGTQCADRGAGPRPSAAAVRRLRRAAVALAG